MDNIIFYFQWLDKHFLHFKKKMSNLTTKGSCQLLFLTNQTEKTENTGNPLFPSCPLHMHLYIQAATGESWQENLRDLPFLNLQLLL